MSDKIIQDLDVALAAGAASAKPHTISPIDPRAPVFVIPERYRMQVADFDESEKWLVRPIRKRGEFSFADADSFVRYFNEHKSDESRIFASITDAGASFEGVLNFHGKDSSWNDHKCDFKLQPTHEWNIWCGNNKKEMSQAQFASFLEENQNLFVEPNGKTLLELVSTLEGKCNADFSQGIKLQSGAVDLEYTEQIELTGGIKGPKTGQMKVPTKFKVSIAPFEGTPHYTMEARLRYRINNRKLSFYYETVEQHLVVRTVAADVIKIIESKTKVCPFKV